MRFLPCASASGGRAERLLSGNVLASHQHDDGESKGRSQIGIGKAEALCAVRVAGGIVRHREPSRIGADDGIDVRSSIKKAVAMHELAAGRMAENDDLSLGMGSCADSGNDMAHGIEGPVVSWLDRSFLAFLVLHVSFLIPARARIFLRREFRACDQHVVLHGKAFHMAFEFLCAACHVREGNEDGLVLGPGSRTVVVDRNRIAAGACLFRQKTEALSHGKALLFFSFFMFRQKIRRQRACSQSRQRFYQCAHEMLLITGFHLIE